jgi:hypothetical protein
MKPSTTILLVAILFLSACTTSGIKKENEKTVELVNKMVDHIDSNKRVQILEDDFHEGDSVYKIRAYYYDDYLIKIVTVMRTSHFERDDYFYFENHEPIFSGHLVNEKDAHWAAEYKYYYEGGRIVESLFWKDTYEPGKQFPHERFRSFDPNIDSLMDKEKERLKFSLDNLALTNIEIRHLNENLEANTE